MKPGSWGKITITSRGGKFLATTYVRDADGKRREVERSGQSPEAARRNLQEHLVSRRAPRRGAEIAANTEVGDLFTTWVERRSREGAISDQTRARYVDIWNRHGDPALGGLQVAEVDTGRIQDVLDDVSDSAPSSAHCLRVMLRGMFTLAVQRNAVEVNRAREVSLPASKVKPVRAVTRQELVTIRAALRAESEKPGPKPGAALPAFIELLVATGCRPNEVLALRWKDVALEADPPTATVTGTLIDHGRIPGLPVHRQEGRKGRAPAHTVLLPDFAVTVLRSLPGGGGDDPVLANRDGGWHSLANLRRALRSALPSELQWVTPYSFRRTVATVLRDGMGLDAAQQQLSHSRVATTEQHYLERRTSGPDARHALTEFADSVLSPYKRPEIQPDN